MSGTGNDEIGAAVLEIQKRDLGQQRVISAWGVSTPSTPINMPNAFQSQQRVITPVFNNNPPVISAAPVVTTNNQTYQVPVSMPTYQVASTPAYGGNHMTAINLESYVLPNWGALPDMEKKSYIDQKRAGYQMILNSIKKEDVNAKIDVELAQIQAHLGEANSVVTRSNQIINIKTGFAIPSYASKIEVVNMSISSNIRHNGIINGIIPQDSKRINLFGSINNYGQGLNVESLMDRDGGFKQLGNLENTFICQLNISHIKSDLHAPIGVTFGEFDGSGTKVFKPYKESMGYVNPMTGKRYHYIIPANANIDSTVTVYVNSKEADHLFGYYYSWLTPSVDDIIKRNQKGLVGDEYLYELDHPISRYLHFYAVEEGFICPPLDEKTGFVHIKQPLAEYIARRIASLVMLKIPTRNLEKFDMQFEVINDNVVKTRMDNDMGQRTLDGIKSINESINSLVDALREKLVTSKAIHNQYSGRSSSDNLSFPFHFELSMVYLFRDKAEDVYKREKEKMANAPGMY